MRLYGKYAIKYAKKHNDHVNVVSIGGGYTAKVVSVDAEEMLRLERVHDPRVDNNPEWMYIDTEEAHNENRRHRH